jgi:hypothetical protein
MWTGITSKRWITVLGIRRMCSEHTDENLKSVVLELLKGYMILEIRLDTSCFIVPLRMIPLLNSYSRSSTHTWNSNNVAITGCVVWVTLSTSVARRSWWGGTARSILPSLKKHCRCGDYTNMEEEELWKILDVCINFTILCDTIHQVYSTTP